MQAGAHLDITPTQLGERLTTAARSVGRQQVQNGEEILSADLETSSGLSVCWRPGRMSARWTYEETLHWRWSCQPFLSLY